MQSSKREAIEEGGGGGFRLKDTVNKADCQRVSPRLSNINANATVLYANWLIYTPALHLPLNRYRWARCTTGHHRNRTWNETHLRRAPRACNFASLSFPLTAFGHAHACMHACTDVPTRDLLCGRYVAFLLFFFFSLSPLSFRFNDLSSLRIGKKGSVN